jgi:NAD(P)H-hydrate epimerase
MADALRCHVVRKGSTTIVAAPDGRVRMVTIADRRLATAGTGDVLAGVILGALALGAAPFDAAAAGPHLHAMAARMGPAEGLIARDLLELIPSALAAVRPS